VSVVGLEEAMVQIYLSASLALIMANLSGASAAITGNRKQETSENKVKN